MGNRILFWFCVPFTVCALLGALCGSALSFLIILFISSAICFFFLLGKGKRKACAALCIGICFSFIWQSFWYANDRLPRALFEKVPKLSVRAVSYSEKTNSGEGIFFDAEILDIGKNVCARVYVPKCNDSVLPNDKITVYGTLKQLENDEQFAEKTYYKSRNIDVMFFADSMSITERSKRLAADTLPCIIAKRVKDKIDELYCGEEGEILKSLLLGETSGLSDEFYFDLRSTGLAHAVSVSGMHIAFIVGFLIIFSKNKYLKLLAIPIIFMFALIVGAPESALRAVIMQTIVVLSHIFMRESDSLTNISLGAFLLVAINPYCVSDIAFLLSFASTVGIVILYEPIMTSLMLLAPKKKGRGRKFCATVFCIFAVSVSASLAASPISAYSFGRISVIAPFANVVMNGIITVVFVAGFLNVIAGFIYMPIAKGVAFVIKYIIIFMKNAISLLAKLPVTEIFTGEITTVLLVAFLCAVIVLSVMSGRKQIRLRHTVAVIVIAFAAFTAVNALTAEKIPEDRIRFDVLDVGQGQCIVATKGDICIVVDCGGDKPADNICVSHLLKLGVRDIDKLILTHSHNDHTSGVPYLLSAMKVKELYAPMQCETEREFSDILKNVGDTKLTYVERNMAIDLTGMKISLLAQLESGAENEDGLTVILTEDDYDLLITGDLPAKREKEILSHIPDCESYVAGHHGAASSSSLALLNKALPELCAISVGLDNKYGHPTDDVLDRLEKIGANIGRTDYDGTLTFYSE